ncbi:hypothetical protein [Hyphomicrobium sp.]|uniref:hypothetical protein n=1 Tax=Hyphomicrobium sp. TaxID=82 RepID=UPI001D55F779|nr:hypothetical protein [Hyphomicrobium sp.]MBY0559132.1 hypothetical protein [Hyphomicrobium sp.]
MICRRTISSRAFRGMATGPAILEITVAAAPGVVLAINAAPAKSSQFDLSTELLVVSLGHG